jgi:hypothetical protein
MEMEIIELVIYVVEVVFNSHTISCLNKII